MNDRLLQFTNELLDRHGAAIEPISPDGLELLLPEPLQNAMNLPEEARLGFSSELPDQAQRVSLESDWMDCFSRLLGDEGHHGDCAWSGTVNPPSSPERILEHGLKLSNAVYRLQDVKPARTRYLILLFRHTAISDEKREGLIKIGFNMANGATLDGMLNERLDPLQTEAKQENGEDGHWQNTATTDATPLPDSWSEQQINEAIQRALPQRVRTHLDPFIQSLQRRQERDLQRLRDYHTDLGSEAVKRLTTSLKKNQPDKEEEIRKQHEQRLASISHEFRAKVKDVQRKYAMTIRMEWIQSLCLTVPVYRFNLLIKRRKGERHLFLDWNPITRKLENPPCEATFAADSTRVVCDDALHLVVPDAHKKCPNCGKPFCRACQPVACPKCRFRSV